MEVKNNKIIYIFLGSSRVLWECINVFRTNIKNKAFVLDTKTDTKIFISWKGLPESLFCANFFHNHLRIKWQ